MKVIRNVDTLLLKYETLVGSIMVATFYPESSLLVMHDGCSKYLASSLRALRKYQKANNQAYLPVRVEYW
jgi:hypothetical protein